MAVDIVEIVVVVGEFRRERKSLRHQRREVPGEVERALQGVDEMFRIAALRGERPRIEVDGRTGAARGAVGILARHLDRRDLAHLGEYLVRSGAGIGLVLDDTAQAEAQHEAFGHVDIDVRTEIIAVRAGIGPVVVARVLLEQAALAGVTHVDEITDGLVAAADVEVVDCLERIALEEVVHPVDARIEIGIAVVAEFGQLIVRPREFGRGAAAVAGRLVHQRGEFVAVDILREAQSVQAGPFGAERHLRLAHAAFLGVDQNDAVGAAHAVDRRGRCILENRDGLDLRNVDQVHVAFDAVDEDQRIAVLPRSHAADEDGRRVVARLTGTLAADDAGHRTAQHVREGDGSHFFELLGLHVRQGPGDGFLFLDAVTDDDDILHFGRSLTQDDVLGRLSVVGDLLGLEAEETEGQDGARGEVRQLIPAVRSGRGARRGALDQYADADDRLSLDIEDQAADSTLFTGLGGRRERQAQHGGEDEHRSRGTAAVE